MVSQKAFDQTIARRRNGLDRSAALDFGYEITRKGLNAQLDLFSSVGRPEREQAGEQVEGSHGCQGRPKAAAAKKELAVAKAPGRTQTHAKKKAEPSRHAGRRPRVR